MTCVLYEHEFRLWPQSPDVQTNRSESVSSAPFIGHCRGCTRRNVQFYLALLRQLMPATQCPRKRSDKQGAPAVDTTQRCNGVCQRHL